MKANALNSMRLLAEYPFLLQTLRLGDGREKESAKNKLTAYYPYIKGLAQHGDVKATYYLALSHPNDSKRHMSLLKDAANLGSLDAAHELLQHHLAALSLKQAVKLTKQLLTGDDLFLKDEAQLFMDTHPAIHKILSTQKPYKQAQAMLFFKPQKPIDIRHDVSKQERHTATNSR